jgi:hypothetical protein
LAIGHGRCGVDLCGPDGLYAGRDRLAKSAIDVAARERGLSWLKLLGGVHFLGATNHKICDSLVAWTLIVTLCLMTSMR